MIKFLSVVLCCSGFLFLSMSVWILYYGQGEFVPSVLSRVALAPCWDNMANAQNACAKKDRRARTQWKCSASTSHHVYTNTGTGHMSTNSAFTHQKVVTDSVVLEEYTLICSEVMAAVLIHVTLVKIIHKKAVDIPKQ